MTFGWITDLKLGARESLYHDLLRVFLISQVIVGHAVALTLPQMPQLLGDAASHWPEIIVKLATRYGPQAAYLFIFLSGYMVAGPLLHAALQKQPMSFADFVRRRLRRLMPGVFVGLLVTCIFDGFGIYVLGKTAFYRDVLDVNAVSNFSLPILIGNVFFLEPTFLPAFGSNGPLWTLGYIFQFYFAGFVIFLLLRIKPVMGVFMALLFTAGAACFRPEWSVLLLVWILGGLMRILAFPGIKSGLLLTTAFLLFVISNAFTPIFSAMTSGLVGVLLIIGLRNLEFGGVGILEEIIRSTAAKTYIAYAIHFPILALVAVLFDHRYPPLVYLTVVVATSGLGMFVIIATYNSIEKYFFHYGK